MTPRKMRPLRELRRLRSLGDRETQVPKDNVRSLDSDESERNNLWPVERVLVTPRTIVDIQVLAEAGHSGSTSDPRAGFVAVVDRTGNLSAVERLTGDAKNLRKTAKGISQAFGRSSLGTPVLGLLDQPGTTRPATELLSELDKALAGTTFEGKYLILSHSSNSLDAAGNAPKTQGEIVQVASNHVRWSSWNEYHELAAMTVGFTPINLEVV